MALSGTVLQIRMHYPPLHIRDMTASHEDGPDIDHSWLKPVNYVLQDEAGNLHAKSWAEALDVVKQRLAGLSGDQIRGIAGKLADAESMVALKVGAAEICGWPLEDLVSDSRFLANRSCGQVRSSCPDSSGNPCCGCSLGRIKIVMGVIVRGDAQQTGPRGLVAAGL